ncbi:iron-containing alcohol dehydrogenase [Solibacillus silvestris]|uniref:iron-containing alcohol dehydrogenase n=1 Tax=Solibacillus silvestris TaxID=76853 RepID=UPI003F805E4C
MMAEKISFVSKNHVGWGAIQHLNEEAAALGAKKILVVTDPFLVDLGMVDKILNKLDSKFEINLYTKVSPEPSLEMGEELVAYTRENKSELVIGIGGGSALDLAKIAAVLATHDGKVKDYLNISGTRQLENKGLPKILIPTTSGTGSEITNISVLALESTKDVVTHDFLLADVAIVDPELTLSLPPKITASTGIDALTHAIEAYVSINASPTTDALAIKAIQLIGKSIRKAVKEGNDVQARTDLSYGSYLAGLAFYNAGVAGVHALAYPLGGKFHIAHGESNAVLLPYVMEYIRSSCKKRMTDIYGALGYNPLQLSEEEASIKCVEQLRNLVKDVGIPLTLKEFNIEETDLQDLTKDAINQKRLLGRSPMPLLAEDIYSIYKAAYDGTAAQ